MGGLLGSDTNQLALKVRVEPPKRDDHSKPGAELLGENMSRTVNRTSRRPTREAFFVRVRTEDDIFEFFNASDHIGRPMPFQKPNATCAMRVTDNLVAFSLLHLTKSNVASLVERPIAIPHGPLTRLERRSALYNELKTDEVVVEVSTRNKIKTTPPPAPQTHNDTTAVPEPVPETIPDTDTNPLAALLDIPTQPPTQTLPDLGETFTEDANSVATSEPDSTSEADASAEPTKNTDEPKTKPKPRFETVIDTYRFTLTRDANGVATLVSDEPDQPLELGYSAAQLAIYLKSPTVGRNIAVGFIGHLGKPNTTETIARAASAALNSISLLAEFRVLADIERLTMPPATYRAAVPVSQRVSRDAAWVSNVWLYSDEFELLNSGEVVCEVDLDNANPTSGKLLVNYTPAEHLEQLWPTYRNVFDRLVADHFRETLGDADINQITYDIVLGDLDDGTVERILDAGKTLPGYNIASNGKSQIHQ